MTEKVALTEELASMVGKPFPPEIIEVERGHIRKFAEAVGDANPLWQDEAYALKTHYKSIIAPPTFLQDEGTIDAVDKLMEVNCPLKNLLNGGMEVECYEPMKPGDVITTQAKLVSLQEKEGKKGKLIIMVVEVTYTNQQGHLVAIGRHNFIRR
jgi:acyl dehydratase